MEETRGERGRGEKESKMSQKVTFDADFLKYTLQSTKSQTYTFKVTLYITSRQTLKTVTLKV